MMVTRLKPADDGEFVLDDAGSFVGYWEYKSLFDRHHEAQAEIARLQTERDAIGAATFRTVQDALWEEAKYIKVDKVFAEDFARVLDVASELIPDASKATLDRFLAQAKAEGWEEGMREAAGIAANMSDNHDRENDYKECASSYLMWGMRDAILAAAEKEPCHD